MTDERASRLRTGRWTVPEIVDRQDELADRFEQGEVPADRPQPTLPMTVDGLKHRLNLIAAIHARYHTEDVTMLGARITIDKCGECGEPYPCDTRRIALGGDQD